MPAGKSPPSQLAGRARAPPASPGRRSTSVAWHRRPRLKHSPSPHAHTTSSHAQRARSCFRRGLLPPQTLLNLYGHCCIRRPGPAATLDRLIYTLRHTLPCPRVPARHPRHHGRRRHVDQLPPRQTHHHGAHEYLVEPVRRQAPAIHRPCPNSLCPDLAPQGMSASQDVILHHCSY